MLEKGFLLDGIRWVIGQRPPKSIPLCPTDFIELDEYPDGFLETNDFKCEECGKIYHLPRETGKEKAFVLRKINSGFYKSKKYINLDDIEVPIAENKISKNSKYFVTSVLTKSKVGLRLIVYAGEKGKKTRHKYF